MVHTINLSDLVLNCTGAAVAARDQSVERSESPHVLKSVVARKGSNGFVDLIYLYISIPPVGVYPIFFFFGFYRAVPLNPRCRGIALEIVFNVP